MYHSFAVAQHERFVLMGDVRDAEFVAFQQAHAAAAHALKEEYNLVGESMKMDHATARDLYRHTFWNTCFFLRVVAMEASDKARMIHQWHGNHLKALLEQHGGKHRLTGVQRLALTLLSFLKSKAHNAILYWRSISRRKAHPVSQAKHAYKYSGRSLV